MVPDGLSAALHDVHQLVKGDNSVQDVEQKRVDQPCLVVSAVGLCLIHDQVNEEIEGNQSGNTDLHLLLLLNLFLSLSLGSSLPCPRAFIRCINLILVEITQLFIEIHI